jgi:boron transporter
MILSTSSLLPALAYTLDMYRRTGEFFGVNEGLFSSALAAMVFSILGTQPLTIVGVTGLISLFNFTIYNIIEIYDVSIYPQFICWTAIWAAIFHWAVAIFNWCDYMRYVTDFSSESFGMYVGIIYISGSTFPLSVHAMSPNIHLTSCLVKGVEELVDEFSRGSVDGFLSCVIAILYFGTIYGLEKLGSGLLWTPATRGFLADYAYPVSTSFAHWPSLAVLVSYACDRLAPSSGSASPISPAR